MMTKEEAIKTIEDYINYDIEEDGLTLELVEHSTMPREEIDRLVTDLLAVFENDEAEDSEKVPLLKKAADALCGESVSEEDIDELL